MRILHVIPGLTVERGGPSTVLAAVARHQVLAGHSVSVLTTDQGARHGERPLELEKSIAVERCAVSGPDRVSYSPGFRAAARQFVRQADIVHLHSIFTYPVHAALDAARRAGVPTILRPCGHLHHYSLQRSRVAKQFYLRVWGRDVTDAVTAWHYTSEQEAAESWPGGERRHFVLPNGIEADEFAVDRDQARAAVAARWPELASGRYVLFLARLHPKKRLDLLLDAFLSADIPDCKLVVAGPDEQHLWEGLSQRFLNASNQHRVVRLEMVSGDAKRDLLAGAMAFALSSEHENFGVAALEAIATGTPALLSPQVDLATAVSAAGWGKTIPLDIAMWSSELRRFAASTPESTATTDERRTWVEQNYSWKQIVSRLLDRYRELQTNSAPQLVTTCP